MQKGMAPIFSVVIVIAIIAVLGYFAGPSLMSMLSTAGESYTPGVKCPDTTTLGYSAARNVLNSSLEYEAGTVVYTKSDGKAIVATDTMTAGGSLSYKSTTIPCTSETYGTGVYAYALADASRSSDKSDLKKFNGGTSVTADLVQPETDQLTGTMYDTTLTNTSETSLKGTIAEETAVAMSAGDSRSGYVDFSQGTASAQYGSNHAGILWCIDTVDSAAFTDNAISLVSQSSGLVLTTIDCNQYPKTTSVDSCNRCYKSGPIKSTDGTLRVAWTMTNDGGSDAGASSDPVLYIEDIVYFQDTDGTVKEGTHDAASTNKGETQVSLTWANS